MTDPNGVVEGQGQPAGVNAGGNAGTPGGAEISEAQRILNREDKKNRLRVEKAESEARELREKLQALEAEKMSEADRRIEEERRKVAAERDAHWAPALKAEKVGRWLERELIAAGAEVDDVAYIDAAAVDDPEAAKEAVAALIARKPHLVVNREAAPVIPGQSGTPRRAASGVTGSGNLTMSQVRSITADPEAYAKRKDEIGRAFREGRITPD